MSQRASSRGDREKAPIYATSHGGDVSNDETASAGKHAARVLQSHFDCEGDDPRPISGIPIETRSKRWHSVEMANVSSESHIVSNGASSWCRLARGRGPPKERCKLRISS